MDMEEDESSPIVEPDIADGLGAEEDEVAEVALEIENASITENKTEELPPPPTAVKGTGIKAVLEQRPRIGIPRPSKEFDDMDYDMTVRVQQNVIKFGYDGEVDEKGRKHGRGILKYPDGNIYEGNFVANKRHGYGILRYANGDIYEGEWKDGKKQGRAKFIFKATGDIYYGNWVNDKRQGHGTYIYADNSIYEGGFLNNRKNGNGMFTYPNGDIHQGYYKGGLKNGLGKILYANGDILEANFNDDKITPPLIAETSNRYLYGKTEDSDVLDEQGHVSKLLLYEGDFTPDGIKTGRGKFHYDDADYEGEVKNGKRHGKGILTYKSGDIYNGNFHEDKKHGKGKYIMNPDDKHGNKYSGDYVMGVKEGQGIITSYSDMRSYEGQFHNDKRHGRGKLLTHDRHLMYEGEWVDDRPVGAIKEAYRGIVW